MTINQQQSYELGPNFPDDFNQIYASITDQVEPGIYTYDIVVSIPGGSSASYTVTTEISFDDSCADSEACNYSPMSMCFDNCVYADEFEDCEGNCLNDVNENGLCDET